MREDQGNMWDFPSEAYVITTNGFVKNNGECVMGRGCAREAALRWPKLPLALGTCIKFGGNHVHGFHFDEALIMTYPVKHHWREAADLALIERSAHELVRMADQQGVREAIMPRPGCGNGRLDWEDVWPIIEPILDD